MRRALRLLTPPSMLCVAFHTTPLPYRGVLIEVQPDEPVADFGERIRQSLQTWRAAGLKSAVLKLPIEKSALAAEAAEHGFEYHHAEKRHAILKSWLQPQLEDKFPAYATHQVGGAGFTVDDEGRLLVVREWRENADGVRVANNVWKLPGGILDRGESFSQGVRREVQEETGVATEFCSLLAFWNRHGLTWGQSDLYFIARLRPTSAEIRMQEDEIAECRWMPLDEFVRTQEHPLILAICRRLYGITKESVATQEASAGGIVGGGGERPEISSAPLSEMIEEGVQWPGREPYLTYFAAPGRCMSDAADGPPGKEPI